MDIRHLVQKYLEDNGYDGLYCPKRYSLCKGCALHGKLAPLGCNLYRMSGKESMFQGACRPGYLHQLKDGTRRIKAAKP